MGVNTGQEETDLDKIAEDELARLQRQVKLFIFEILNIKNDNFRMRFSIELWKWKELRCAVQRSRNFENSDSFWSLWVKNTNNSC